MTRPANFCEACEQEIAPGVACIVQRVEDENGEILITATFDPERDGAGDVCHDCGTPVGGAHHPACESFRLIPERPPQVVHIGGSRAELVGLVQRIIDSPGASDEQLDAWIDEVSKHVPHPRVSALIFWPSREGLGRDPSAEEIVDAALSYQPVALGPARPPGDQSPPGY